MPTAAKIFVFDERPGDSRAVETIWRTRSEPFDSFISVAASHWEMVVTRQDGHTSLTVRGPETRATSASIPQDAEFFGIQFRLGAFVPILPLGRLADRSVTLPDATTGSFWLNGSAWEFPSYDNADVFVERLVRKGLLVQDSLVEDVTSGGRPSLSPRSVQRRVLRATGLTQGEIRQIARARMAFDLLEQGATVLDTVARTGYADQAHLSRSLKRFLGQTPVQIARAGGRL